MLTFRGEHVQLIPEAPLGIRHEAGQGCVLRQPDSRNAVLFLPSSHR